MLYWFVFLLPPSSTYQVSLRPTSVFVRLIAIGTGIEVPLMSDDELWTNIGELSIDGDDISIPFLPFLPCVPRYFPDPGDENLQRIGGQKLYVVRVGHVPGVYSSWCMRSDLGSFIFTILTMV